MNIKFENYTFDFKGKTNCLMLLIRFACNAYVDNKL